jgi:hypothetical protein
VCAFGAGGGWNARRCRGWRSWYHRRRVGDGPGNGCGADDATPAPVDLSVADDHVAAFAKARKPIIAIEELVWNALDADAENISVELDFTKLGGLDSILVTTTATG